MPNSGLCYSCKPHSENQRKQKERQVLRSCQRTKKAMEYESDSDTNRYWYTRNNSQRLGKGIGRVSNQKTIGDHRDYGIVKTSPNTVKSPGDLRRLAVTQTPMKWC